MSEGPTRPLEYALPRYPSPDRPAGSGKVCFLGFACSAMSVPVWLGWYSLGHSTADHPLVFLWMALASIGLAVSLVGLYRPPSAPRMRRWAAAFAAIAFAVPVMAANYFPVQLCHSSNRVKCASNLKQIGLACLMYVNQPEHGGRFPNSFAEVLENEDITSDVFLCPSTTDTLATGPTTRAVAANLTAGGHLSYVYTGKGLTLKSPPNAVVAYEPLSNHSGQGMNVLLADGSVVWQSAPVAAKIVAELQAGYNPPRPQMLQATTQAATQK